MNNDYAIESSVIDGEDVMGPLYFLSLNVQGHQAVDSLQQALLASSSLRCIHSSPGRLPLKKYAKAMTSAMAR
jgi:hypothetical protein